MDQRALVERAANGDRDAFGALIRPVAARLDAAARLILRDPELARDAVRAWRDLPRLRDADRFDAWLRRLLVNSAMEERRRRRRVIAVELAGVDAPSPETRLRASPTATRSTACSPAWRRSIARSSSFTTTSAFHCPRRRRPSASRSPRRSRGFTARSRSPQASMTYASRPGAQRSMSLRRGPLAPCHSPRRPPIRTWGLS